VDYEARGKDIVVGSPKNQATNIPGLFAVGECEFQYHGANRLGANSLLSCVYAGMIGGPAMASYAKNASSSAQTPDDVFEKARKGWKERLEGLLKMHGTENPFVIGQELGEAMTTHCTVVRDNQELTRLLDTLRGLEERWKRVDVLDTGHSLNQSALYVHQLSNMLVMARTIATAALRRDECRGSHYKPAFALPPPKTKDPKADLEWMALWQANTDKWRKTTLAAWTAQGPDISYRDIPSPVLPVEPRYYE
jgi:succinate dehydrogenase / fumarate reductase flavoprotein subunit